jgi:hypothetical protein
MNASIKTLATKNDILCTKDELAYVKYYVSKSISNSIKWMFVFWVGDVGSMLAIALLIL